jgi:hypothetical protein
MEYAHSDSDTDNDEGTCGKVPEDLPELVDDMDDVSIEEEDSEPKINPVIAMVLGAFRPAPVGVPKDAMEEGFTKFFEAASTVAYDKGHHLEITVGFACLKHKAHVFTVEVASQLDALLAFATFRHASKEMNIQITEFSHSTCIGEKCVYTNSEDIFQNAFEKTVKCEE